MKKLLQIFSFTMLTCLSYMAQAQEPEWYREQFMPQNNAGDKGAITVRQSDGAVFITYRIAAEGKILIARFNPDGDMVWADTLGGASASNPASIVLNVNGRLFVAHDAQTVTLGYQTPGVIEVDPETGAIIQAVYYDENFTSREVSQMSLDANGVDLILICRDAILFVDEDDLSINSQYGNLGLNLVETDGAVALDAGFLSPSINTESLMPFSVGSTLPGTPVPTDIYNDGKVWLWDSTYSENDTIFGEQTPLDSNATFTAAGGITGAFSQDYEACKVLSDGSMVIYHTATLGGNENQFIIKTQAPPNRDQIEWTYHYRQAHEPGCVLVDGDDNIYLITWDQLFYLNSPAIDILISKFSSEGDLMWSKVYGNGTNGGNEVIWNSGAAVISNDRIAINSYTDSYDFGTPKSAMLILDFDGIVQNYSIVGPSGTAIFGLGDAFDGAGHVYGLATDFSGTGGHLFKVGTATVFENNHPVVTSGDSVCVLDTISTSDVVINVEGNDGDGGANDAFVWYHLTGDDADDFDIDSATGEISFVVAPDWDAPHDLNQDNENEITVTITDTLGLESEQDISIWVKKYCVGSSSSIAPVACDSYTSPSGMYTWSTSGMYMDTIPNAEGCDSVITIDLTINNASSATIQAEDCDSMVSPSGMYTWMTSGMYMDTIPNMAGCDSVITIDLTINNSSSSLITPVACDSMVSPSGMYVWMSTGTYMDTIPNSVGCDSVITVELTINTVDATVTVTSPMITAIASGAVYTWLDCDDDFNPISGESGQSFTATVNGNYAVEVTLNGCSDTSSCENINDIITSYASPSEFAVKPKLYPNPSNGLITVDFGTILNDVSIIVTNPLGEQILSKSASSSDQVDLSFEGESGIYLIQVSSAYQHAVLRAVKE